MTDKAQGKGLQDHKVYGSIWILNQSSEHFIFQ